MGRTLDLGRRIELFSMDRQCHDISLGLYCRDDAGTPQVLVHTYATAAGVDDRVKFVSRALRVMAGLEDVTGSPGWLQFPCRSLHQRALKRAFLDLCRRDQATPLEPKPLTAFDKKAGCNLTAVNLDGGSYEVRPEEQSENGEKRAGALAGGLVKLCELQLAEDTANQVVFPCGSNHHQLIGLLLVRAQNVRASLREEGLAATRGVLSAPSQQE